MNITFLNVLARGWGLDVVPVTLSDGDVVRSAFRSPEVKVPALGVFHVVLVGPQVGLLVGRPVVWPQVVGVLNQTGAVKAARRVATPDVWDPLELFVDVLALACVWSVVAVAWSDWAVCVGWAV